MLSTRPLGFEHERKALVLLVTSFYVLFFLLVALAAYGNEEPAWARCFVAMVLCYGVGFFALASEWFWGRWYTIGIGYSGLTTAVWAMVTMKQVEPVLLIYGITHGLMALLLQGDRMIALFDGKAEWKQKLGLDEESADRVKKTVIRAVSGLPTFIMFALAPRGDSALFYGPALLGMLALFGTGLYGVLKGRTLGILSMAAALCIGLGFFVGPNMLLDPLRVFAQKLPSPYEVVELRYWGIELYHSSRSFLGIGIVALSCAIAPFVGPLLSKFRHRHSW